MKILVNVHVMIILLEKSVNIVNLDVNISPTVFHVIVIPMGLLIRIVIQLLEFALVMKELKESNVPTVLLNIMIQMDL
jgi:hypothetical protein